ncbi:MAG: transcription-repair coupling factor [candidate division KSB1 bacterium]|nr:transcription-repair coupling factor [candidate division KSB1 bacterium]
MRELWRALDGGTSLLSAKAPGSLRRALVAAWLQERQRRALYVTTDPLSAEQARDDFATLLGAERAVHFPDPSETPLAFRLQSLSRQSAQVRSLELLRGRDPAVAVTTLQGLSSRLLPPQVIDERCIILRQGQEYDFETFLAALVDLGFVRETMVDRAGEMSVRGGIVDIFPYSRLRPVRVEFFGNTVESLREFDPETQRSVARVEEVALIPQFPVIDNSVHLQDTARSASLVGFVQRGDLVVLEDTPEPNTFLASGRSVGLCEGAQSGGDGLLEGEFRGKAVLWFPPAGEDVAGPALPAEPAPPMAGKYDILREYVASVAVRCGLHALAPPLVCFLCDSPSQRDRVEALFEEEGVDGLRVEVGALQSGFVLWDAGLCVLAHHEFHSRARVPHPAPRPREGFTFRQLHALRPGDYVVHVDYGVGVYQGLRKISVDGSERECLEIAYQDDDRVYVPLERMDRVSKYTPREGVAPRINRLGTAEWERLKARAKRRLKDISAELIKLYAERRHTPGFAFSADSLWQHELEASFVYDETPDQLQAVADVKRDMEAPRPMDRLVCGDVGFGKTEVAIRAAFKAVNDGKQVAVLVPTTLLASQHLATFRERLAPFPVRVEMLSRFIPKGKQERILADLRAGRVDIIIGTHRLLSADVRFHDLGLLIIDEEQRFGVMHKERLKALRTNVDVLTLTATPIPRTLHMALVGITDMSRIDTPPRDRRPIRTEVVQFSKELIRQAILRELGRGGQVFFVHNRVQSIGAMVEMLRRLVPEASFAVAHGQMPSAALERVVNQFIERRYDCLVSTMIIQAGLDMPNVNTLIVSRADRFGLAQLYQLRGRVGRSTQQAYAYFLVPSVRRLTKEAIKRLQAIEEITELGSGYQVALKDLEVRGAGSLFGIEQSGFLDALGYDVFCRILEEAVQEVMAEQAPREEPIAPKPPVTQMRFRGDAFLPEDYVAQSSERVAVYRRLVAAPSLAEIEDMERELVDRFGPLPEQARNLLDAVTCKILGNQLLMSEVQVDAQTLRATFVPSVTVDKQAVARVVSRVAANERFPFRFVQGKSKRDLSLLVELPGEGGLKAAKEFLQSML